MNIVLFDGDHSFSRQDSRYQHIKKILKKTVGDAFWAGLVNGPEGTATITSLDEDSLGFSFVEERPARSLYPLYLIVGYPRPIQLKRLLRDVASLGVAAVYLAGTELGEKSYRESSLVDRGAALEGLREGCVQAGGTMIPDLKTFASVQEAISQIKLGLADGPAPGARYVLLDTVDPDCALIDSPLADLSFERPLVMAIGSERGWTVNERSFFRKAGFTVCSMGSRILRTETAATAAVSIALAKSGYMDGPT